MLADRIKETTTTTGTGSYALAGAASGYQTFVAGIGTGNSCFYVVQMEGNWEVGIGTVTDATPDTLSRTTIIASSNANAAVNWGAGTKTVFCAPPARNFLPVRHNFGASAAPTYTDDSTLGYDQGSLWVDTTNVQTWLCLDPFATAATWVKLDLLSRVKQANSGGGTLIGQAGDVDTDSILDVYSVFLAKYAAVNVTGDYSVILGGGAHVGTENFVVYAGLNAKAKHRGSRVHGYSRGTISYTDAGNHQYERAGFAGQTTNATPTELFLSDSAAPSARFVIPTDSVLTFCIMGAAITSDGAQGAGYKIEGVIRRDGSADPAFVGTPTTTVLGEDAAGWDFAASIDTTNDSLKLTVTGAAATTINWTAVLEATQAAFSPT